MFKTSRLGLPFAAALASAAPVHADGIDIKFHGVGWAQGGNIVHVSDTVSNGAGMDFNGNWSQNSGGLMTAVADLGGGWDGSAGVGAIQTHNFRGSHVNDWAVGTSWDPFVSEARLTYTHGDPAHPPIQVNLGNFPFNYNPDTKNLGLYLLRGMVYPGIVLSGFETKAVLPIASIFGTDIRHEFGGYRGDFIVNSETDVNPYFDLSFAYLFHFQLMDGFELGGGANWYRAIANRPKLTSPGKDCENLSRYTLNSSDQEVCYILDTLSVDTALGTAKVDTVTGSLSGIKVMGRFSLDPKKVFGLSGGLGPNDLIFYSEAAILGLKDYPKHYDNIWRRIPVMVGFNLPAFNVLDVVSLEVEYYGTRNMNDYEKVIEDISWVPRAKATSVLLDKDGNPRRDTNGNLVTYTTNTRSDDWKWSLYAAKVFAGHIKVSGQVASDHMRTGGIYFPWTKMETLTTPKDWYWMAKLAYFF